ncbi:hypothetical protein TUM3792_29810 [Shewanella sp. MBTL60-007]|nr:hypothetical protein TUM3792_29810 [Shewanella sp. MBTL60-007]
MINCDFVHTIPLSSKLMSFYDPVSNYNQCFDFGKSSLLTQKNKARIAAKPQFIRSEDEVSKL